MGTSAAFTVTVQVAFLLLKVLTVIWAVPGATAVTRPFPSTVATPSALLVQVRADAVLFGSVAFSCRVPPTSRFASVTSRVTFVGAFFTVTVQTSDFLLKVLTVILALPTFTPLTMPSLTVAIFFLLVLQVRAEADLFGSFAVSCSVSPLPMTSVLGSVTLEGAFFTLTVRVTFFLLWVVMVMVVLLPAFTPLTRPVFDTLAIFLFLEE